VVGKLAALFLGDEMLSLSTYLFVMLPYAVFERGGPFTVSYCIPIIGIACGIIGHILHSWKVQVIAGLILIATVILFGLVYYIYVECMFFMLGGILLVIGGYLMRSATSSVTRT
jgi:hypothetical protein